MWTCMSFFVILDFEYTKNVLSVVTNVNTTLLSSNKTCATFNNVLLKEEGLNTPF